MRPFFAAPVFGLAILLGSSALAAPLVYPEGRGSTFTPTGPGAAAIERGFQAVEAGDLLAAETAFRDAIRSDPTAAAAYVGMAELAAQRGTAIRSGNWFDLNEVRTWLQKALEVDPNGPSTLRVWARFQAERGSFAEAETALVRSIAIAPGVVETRLQLAEVQLRGLRNARAAEATARGAVEQNRADVRTWMALATALIAQGRPDDAVVVFNQAAQTLPGDPEPLLALARYQASRTQIDAAIATLDRLIATSPSAGLAYLDRGDLLLLKNDVARATESYRTAVRAAPRVAAAAQLRLATLHEARQQYADAERAYRAAIEAQPNFIPAYNNLAFMFATRKERLDEALRLASRAIELDPRCASCRDTLGWVQHARGDLAAAAASLDRAIELQPLVPAFHHHLGMVMAEQGRKRDAEASLRKALEIDPQYRRREEVERQLQVLTKQQ